MTASGEGINKSYAQQIGAGRGDVMTPGWPFFAQGGTISIREFFVGAFNAEMGLQAIDPDLKAARDAFAALSAQDEADLLIFLSTLVVFPPDDTASNLNPGNRNAANFPQDGHGSIRLPALFNDPNDIE